MRFIILVYVEYNIIMEESYRICQKQAIFTCKCDKNLFFCFKHMNAHLETSGEQHEMIKLKGLNNKFLKKCKFNLEKINKVKNEIIRF